MKLMRSSVISSIMCVEKGKVWVALRQVVVGSKFHICSLMVDHELLDNTQLDVGMDRALNVLRNY